MRMDNETFRIRVENLFLSLEDAEKEHRRPETMAELTRLAGAPRKTRHFLKVVSEQGDLDLQEHFYRYVFSRAHDEHDINDLERHVRHMFYENREHAKVMIARFVEASTLPALFRVTVFTEEGWLAGELIRIALAAPVEHLHDPIKEALESEDYLLQCLAIYLVGKSGADPLLDALAQFYRRPVGEKIDRLESKSLDALMEGMPKASDDLVIKWMKDRSSRVRELGLTAVLNRRLAAAVPDLLGLWLVDSRTRQRTSQMMLQFENEGILSFAKNDERSEPVRRIIGSAKQSAVESALRSLMRDESTSVREVAAKAVRFLDAPEKLGSTLRRLATEDRSNAVQIAALHTLALADRQRLVPAIVEVLTDSKAVSTRKEVAEAAMDIAKTYLDAEALHAVEEGVKAKREQKDAALDLFTSEVEGWRHEI